MSFELEAEIHYIFNSNRLDGVTLTRAQTETILRDGRSPDELVTAPDGTEHEAAVVTSHRDALDRAVLLGNGGSPLTQKTVKELHRVLMEGVLLSNGEFRECTLNSRGIPRLSPDAIPHRLSNLLKLANKGFATKETPEQLAWQVHHEFLAIHPFIEGNGRMARLMLTLARLRLDLPPLVIRFEDQEAYAGSILRYFKEQQGSTA